MYHNPYAQKTYQTANAQTMSAGEQVARLLETAAKHIIKAKQHAQNNEFEARYWATEDCLKIITGLQSCLYETTETMSVIETLHNYYNGIMMMVGKINMKNDVKMCEEVEASLRTMANTWREIEKRTLPTAPEMAVPERVNIAAC